ncbi:MAG: peptidoglycan-binding protein [Candidatus Taylorbacteria bacterium]
MNIFFNRKFAVTIILLGICASEPVLAQTNLSSFQFFNNLSYGSRGADVLALQQQLNSDPDTNVAQIGPGSTGFETEYFGPATHQAVIRFQNKYSAEILVPAGLVGGSGFVGPLTRAKLNSLGTNILPPLTISPSPTPEVFPTNIPVIKEISPLQGPDGTEITIIGENFTPLNDVVTTYKTYSDVPSFDGKTIQFIFSNPPFEELQRIRNKGENIPDLDIPLYVSVNNKNGESVDAALFTIQIKKN